MNVKFDISPLKSFGQLCVFCAEVRNCNWRDTGNGSGPLVASDTNSRSTVPRGIINPREVAFCKKLRKHSLTVLQFCKCHCNPRHWTVKTHCHFGCLSSAASMEQSPCEFIGDSVKTFSTFYGKRNFIAVWSISWAILTLRRLMSYMYGAPILDVSRSHATTQHSR